MAYLRILLLALLHLTGGLKLFVHSPQKALLGSDVLLHCNFSVTRPPVDLKFLAILWRYQDNQILRYDSKDLSHHPRVSFNEQDARNGIASISLSNVTIKDGGMYKCFVIYSPDSKDEVVNLDILVPPVIQIPSKCFHKNEKKTLLCTATGFHPPNINITWLSDGVVLRDSILGKIQKNYDGTYSVNSSVTIMPNHNYKNQTFSCRVKHEALGEPIEENFQLVYKGETRSRILVIIGVSVFLVLLVFLTCSLKILQGRKSWSKASKGFTLSDIKGPDKLIDGEEVTLYCTGSNCAENTQVTWLEERPGRVTVIIPSNEGDLEEAERLLDGPYVINTKQEGSRDHSSSLRFIFRVGNHKDVTFICRVTSDNKTHEERFKCKAIYANPRLVDPVKATLCDSGQILYTLILRDFYPRDIQIGWSCVTGERQETLRSKEQFIESSDPTFMVCSEARISENFFKDPACRVCVTWKHGSMDRPGYKELSIRDPEYIWTPVVELMQTPRLFHGTPANIECKISKYFPDALTVNWLIQKGQQDETLVSDAERVSVKSKKEEDFTYSCSSILTVSPTLRTHQGAEYICRVEHPSLEKPIETRTGKIRVMAKPRIMEPIEMTLGDYSRIHFSLNLQSFHPEDIDITWRNEGEKYKNDLKPVKTQIDEKDLMFNVISECSIAGDTLTKSLNKVCVEWKHVSLDQPESRSLSVRDFPWRPVMEDILIPKLEANRSVTLSCKISGYFPDALSVEWIKKEKGNESEIKLPTDKYKVPDIKSHRQEDKTLACEARLTFTPHLGRDQGAEFICRVRHPTLEQPMERMTGPLLIDQEVTMVPQWHQYGFLVGVAALELNVPSSHRAGMGSDTLIPCTFTEDKPPVDPRFFAVHWYHQGKEILSYDDNVTTINPAFSIDTTKALNGDASLSISGVRVSDVGIYTCSILYSPERKEKEVSFLVYAPPEITITGRIAVINKESILSSSITGFYPVDIDIKWSKDGEILNNYTISVPRRNPDDTYSVNSTVTIIPTEEDKTQTFSCRVQHESLSGLLHKDFQLEYKMKGRRYSLLRKNPDGTVQHDKGQTDTMLQILISILTVVVMLVIVCVIKLRNRRRHRQTNTNDPSPDVNRHLLGSHPHVEEIIVFNQLTLYQKVKLECKISRYDKRDKLTVTWLKLEQGDSQPVTLNPSEIYEIQDPRHEIQEDNTYSCTACLLINPLLSSAQPIEFICRVEHPGLEQPIERRTEPLHLQPKYAQTTAEDPVMRPPESAQRPPAPTGGAQNMGDHPKVRIIKQKFEKAPDSTPEVKYQRKTGQHTPDQFGLPKGKQSQQTTMSPSGQKVVDVGKVIDEKSSEDVAECGMETPNKSIKIEPVTETAASGTKSENIEQREPESKNKEEADPGTEKPNNDPRQIHRDLLTETLTELTKLESLEEQREPESKNKEETGHETGTPNKDTRQKHGDPLTETPTEFMKPESLEEQREPESSND
ncbi:Ig mu heavy chain disease -like [Pelobates cultripes]|uniref:Ig mu heavy chain disease -like n=1 Tax=Pelobates cultripes TaxID=61616 RepID=A0AAD1WEK6_PELCU|nr:Ig mu heavy chain disease -like [Pelobates cultripes]